MKGSAKRGCARSPDHAWPVRADGRETNVAGLWGPRGGVGGAKVIVGREHVKRAERAGRESEELAGEGVWEGGWAGARGWEEAVRVAWKREVMGTGDARRRCPTWQLEGREAEVSGPVRQEKGLGDGGGEAEGVTRVKWADGWADAQPTPNWQPTTRPASARIRSPGFSGIKLAFSNSLILFSLFSPFSTRPSPPSPSPSPPSLHEVGVLHRSSCRPPGPSSTSALFSVCSSPIYRTSLVSFAPTLSASDPVTSRAFDRTRPTRPLPFSGHAHTVPPPIPHLAF